MGSALEWLKSVDTSRKDQYLAQRNRQRQAQRSAAAAPKPKTFGNHGVNNPTKVIDRVARGVTDFEEEKKRKKQEAAQTQTQEKPRTANLVDMTIGSVKRGYTSSQRGKEAYKQMMGQENKLEEYTDLLEGDAYNFEPEGALAKGVSSVAEVLGQQLCQWTDPRSVTAAAGAAGLAAAAGQAGPQVLVPEELITVPAAFAAGIHAGSTLSNFEIEAGNAYLELKENGISEDTAKKIALAVGGGNAALEAVQLDELFKSFKVLDKVGAGDGVTDILLRELKERGINTAKETAQEVAQEGVTIAGSQAASMLEKGDWQYSAEEVAQRLGDTAVSSVLTFGVLNVPSGVRNVSAGLRKSSTTAEPSAAPTQNIDLNTEQQSLELQEENLSPEAAAEFRRGLLENDRSEGKELKPSGTIDNTQGDAYSKSVGASRADVFEHTDVEQQFHTAMEEKFASGQNVAETAGSRLHDDKEIDHLVGGILDKSETKQALMNYFGERAGLMKDDNWKKAHLSSRDDRRLDAQGEEQGAESHFAEAGQLEEMEQRFSDVLGRTEKFANEAERAADDRGTIKYSVKENYESPVYETLETRKPLKATDFKVDKLRRAEAAKKYGLDIVEAGRLKAYVDGYMCYRLNIGMHNNQMTDGEKDIAASIASALRKFPKYSGRTYRNLQFKTEERYNAFFAEYAEGEIVLLKAFTSTSKLPNGYPLFGNGVVHLVVDCEAGCDIADTYGLVRQQEVILLPGTKLKVTKVATANDGNPLIYVQEVAANADNGEDNERDSGDKRPSRGVHRVGYEQGSAVGRRREDPGSVYGEVRRGSGRHGVLPERGESSEAGDVPVSYDRQKFSESDFFYNQNTKLEVPAEIDAEAFLYGLLEPESKTDYAEQRRHSEWLRAIGAQDTELNRVEKYKEARYNNSPEYQLLAGYSRAVEKGDLSPLVGFAEYKRTSEAIRENVVGMVTATDIEIEGFATHLIDRIIGQTSTSRSALRQGVLIEDVVNALKNPLKTGELRTMPDGDIRQTLFGARAAVTISIRDKRLIQTNPRNG